MTDNTAFDSSKGPANQQIGIDVVQLSNVEKQAQEKAEKQVFDPDNGKFIEPYAGMPAEMVRYYSEQPLYKGIRYTLLLILLATMVSLATLAGVTVSRSAPCLESWQEAPIYQVYPRSFKDSNNDGMGDLNGITEKLDYIQELGVGSVWLNPIYDSPQRDMGYDVSDFRAIWPEFGTMEDFNNMLDAMHKRGLKLIMDFVPNHTSDQHEWFLASSDPSHPEHEKYKDYYVWKDRNTDSYCHEQDSSYDYPNNWVSVFSGSAWTWHEGRQQYYLHQFLKEQPDLNLEKDEVVRELVDILDFWLEKGVDGFRVDAVQYSYEAQHFRDEYPSTGDINTPYCTNANSTTDDLFHDFTKNQPGMHDMLQALRDKCKEYSEEPGVDIVMITEAYEFDLKAVSRYYGTSSQEESSFPFNFFMIAYGAEVPFNGQADTSNWKAEYWAYNIIDNWLKAPQQSNSAYKEREWPNWVVSNHDNPRMATKTSPEFARAIAVLIMSLPGTQTLYYGDEIGMIDVPVTEDTDEGGNDRGPCRAPMQWSNSEWAGFTNSTEGPWLPIDENIYPTIYSQINVEDQESEDKPDSLLHLYKKMIALNKESLQLHRGHFCNFDQGVDAQSSPLNNNVLSYLREQNGLKTGYLALFNFDRNSKSLKMDKSSFGHISEDFLEEAIKDEQTSVNVNGDIYEVTLGKYGYLLVEYHIDNGYYFDREGAVCYVAREIEMRGEIAYKVE